MYLNGKADVQDALNFARDIGNYELQTAIERIEESFLQMEDSVEAAGLNPA